MRNSGLLLINLGSPDSTRVKDVRGYLRQFLMDPRVIDAPFAIRWLIVHALILPRRPYASARAYRSIWLPEGSPLIVWSRKVLEALRHRLKIPAELAMRYQNPSIETALQRLHQAGAREVLLIPMFPHYAMSSYETAVVRVKEIAQRISSNLRVEVAAPYYDRTDYIKALASSAAGFLSRDYDHLLISFHGIPERHLRKTDPTQCHCLAAKDCCEVESPAHDTCYRYQCLKTAALLVQRTGIPRAKYSVAFQSRLGKDPWLKPYTDLEIERLAREGKRKLLVLCPAFVADCLETLEEVGIRGRRSFRAAGGGQLTLIPCLNDHPAWIETLEKLAVETLGPEVLASRSGRRARESTPEMPPGLY